MLLPAIVIGSFLVLVFFARRPSRRRRDDQRHAQPWWGQR